MHDRSKFNNQSRKKATKIFYSVPGSDLLLRLQDLKVICIIVGNVLLVVFFSKSMIDAYRKSGKCPVLTDWSVGPHESLPNQISIVNN